MKMGCGFPERLLQAMEIGAITRAEMETCARRIPFWICSISLSSFLPIYFQPFRDLPRSLFPGNLRFLCWRIFCAVNGALRAW